jgi:hypothetical protein
LPESNQRPTDYKSVALPAELKRPSQCYFKELSLKKGCKCSNTFLTEQAQTKKKPLFFLGGNCWRVFQYCCAPPPIIFYLAASLKRAPKSKKSEVRQDAGPAGK